MSAIEASLSVDEAVAKGKGGGRTSRRVGEERAFIFGENTF